MPEIVAKIKKEVILDSVEELILDYQRKLKLAEQRADQAELAKGVNFKFNSGTDGGEQETK